jgi:membrane associated rhomboid family serine protease
MAKLKIKRRSGFGDGLRRYRIAVDDKEVGKLSAGKEIELQITPGEHRVQLRLDWCSSNVLTVNVAEGHEMVLECGNSGNVLDGFFAPNEYLWVRKEIHVHKVGRWKQFCDLIKYIPVTMGILAVLTAVFVLELCFGIGHSDLLSPNIQTHVAFGALYHPLILQGEWYRLFTAALLHANPIHLLFNGFALLLAGTILEGFVGRAWYFAFFVIGGLGGSLMSLAIDPPTIVSIGASGAIMGLFGAAYVCSFHLPADGNRKRFQRGLLQILILSLIPMFPVHIGAHIDYAAHLGGALAGGLAGLILLLTWRKKEGKPGFERLALVLSFAGAACFAYAVIPITQHYKVYVYGAELMPNDAMPKTDKDAALRSAELLKQYPNDPRAHMYRAIAFAQNNDYTDAEREMRTALNEKTILNNNFTPEFRTHLQALLALVLFNEGRLDEAKNEASAICIQDEGDSLQGDLINDHLCK